MKFFTSVLCVMAVLACAGRVYGEELVSVFFEKNAPFSYVSHSRPKGLDYDFFRFLAGEASFEPQIKVLSWERWLPFLNDGTAQVVCSGLLVTEELKKKVLFSIPYRNIKYFLIGHPSMVYDIIPKIFNHSIRVGVIRGSWYADILKHITVGNNSPIDLTLLESLDELIYASEYSTVDLIAVTSEDILSIPEKFLNNLSIFYEFAPKDYYAIAIKDGNYDLQKKLNDLIARLPEKSSWMDLQKKYLLHINENVENGRVYYLSNYNNLTYDICNKGWSLPNENSISPCRENSEINLHIFEDYKIDLVRITLDITIDSHYESSQEKILFSQNRNLICEINISNPSEHKIFSFYVTPEYIYNRPYANINLNITSISNINSINFHSIKVDYD